jgi:hypothetical protein
MTQRTASDADYDPITGADLGGGASGKGAIAQ